MLKTACSAAVIGASVALFTVGTPTVSQAHTEKELSICYVDETDYPVSDLEVVADGPSFKTASLDAGDCAAWDVRPGKYKVTFEDLEELDGQYVCAKGEQTDSGITVERMDRRYEASLTGFSRKGSLTTDVKKDRRTTITIWVVCVDSPKQ